MYAIICVEVDIGEGIQKKLTLRKIKMDLGLGL